MNSIGPNAVAASPPATPIEVALVELDCNIEGLHDSLSALTNRFERVLLSTPPKGDDKAAGAVTGVTAESDMLACINSLKRRVIYANNRIGELLERAQI